mmetsp:Transcript_7733/g.11996  ORF Transcript_7733/g.11996 Transcript_7733/m.11996 type:complete len:183 (+) Transcript_7733:477-1025(+)|eukprot:CAMPEP_0170509896 /NCGR_PEP_ID=MMETSP0208-20121228/65463_1 /TAXON_ID=197538 /ORGANISM="Strombidium inclinatum, Strain S3" /LENGTH=182 /DNA_ID=CAMNT_0010793297 /DNA_START=956 /DNA_END=1504 /DNA_ORIENTATION=+
MFDSLKDVIVIQKMGKPKFLNSHAKILFNELHKRHKGAPPEEADYADVLDRKIFYLYQNLSMDDHPARPDNNKPSATSNLSTSLAPGHCFSISDLLSFDFNVVNHSIFTDSKEISQCSSLDQLHKIIQELCPHEKSDEEGSRLLASSSSTFFQVRLIDVEEEGSRGSEVLIQILDISQRILG